MGRMFDAFNQGMKPQDMDMASTRMGKALAANPGAMQPGKSLSPWDFVETAEATNLPVVSDAASGALGMRALLNGEKAKAAMYGGAALLPFMSMGMVKGVGKVTDALGNGTYLRATPKDSPFNDVPWAMFAETDDVGKTLDDLRLYGKNYWTIDSVATGGVEDAGKLRKEFVRALRDSEARRNMGVTAASIVRESNPSNIVNSAGMWDNPDVVQEIYEKVIGPRGIKAVKTSDGAIVFDPDIIKRFVEN